MVPGVCTIFQGAGAASILGTPCGRQLASGSSLEWEPSVRWSYRALAQGWKGTAPGFRSTAISRTYRLALGSQMPERSGWPSRLRGAGAEGLTFPLEGRFFHCATNGAENNSVAARQTRGPECMAATFRFAYDYIPAIAIRRRAPCRVAPPSVIPRAGFAIAIARPRRGRDRRPRHRAACRRHRDSEYRRDAGDPAERRP